MASDDNTGGVFVPRELKARCVVSAIDKPDGAELGGAFARDRPQDDPNESLSSSLYFTLDNPGYAPKPLVAQRLRSVRQCGGGLLPTANSGLGAPMCTFLYGGIKPEQAHSQLDLILGPPKSVLTVNGDAYDPTFVRDADLGGRQGADPADADPFQVPQYGFLGAQNPTVPSVGQAPFDTGIPPRTTFNVWTAAYGSLDASSIFEAVGNLGMEVKSSADPDVVRKAAVVRQNVTVDGRSAITVNAAPNKEVTLTRLYPISYDLAYATYPVGDAQVSVGAAPARMYYPLDAYAEAQGLLATYREIRAHGGDNCGFQIHLSVAQPTALRHPQSGELSASVEIEFGKSDLSAPANGDVPNRMERFKIKLIPGEKPQLAFWHPALQQFKEIRLKGPIFCPNKKGGAYSVYVHFAGPAMLVGFDPEVGGWNAVMPIRADRAVDDYAKRFVPWIPSDSFIGVTFKGLHATMEYGPAAFNGYNAENVEKGDPSSDLSYLSTRFKVPSAKADLVSAATINDYLLKNRFRNSELEPAGTVDTSVSYYGDWRRIPDAQPEMVYVGDVSLETLKDGQFAVAKGQVDFDTTIEGPIFFKVRNRSGDKGTRPRLLRDLKAWSDITENLRSWDVRYGLEGTTNRSYLEGTATVVLDGLSTTVQGSYIATALKENQLAISLLAGYDDLTSFFVGTVQDYEVENDLEGGSTLRLELKELGNDMLEGKKFPQTFYFAGEVYRRLLGDVFAIGGLQDHFEIQDAPMGGASDDDTLDKFDRFNEALDAALGEAEIELGQGQNAVFGTIDRSLSEVVRPVMELVRRTDGFACLYLDPQQEAWRVVWRLDPALEDSLIMAGEPNDDGVFPNLAEQNGGSIHGVMAGPWRERTNVAQLHPMFIVKSQDLLGEPIFATGFNENGYGEDVIEALDAAIDAGRSFDEYGYVGYPKSYVDESLQGNLLLQNDLNNAADLLKDILFKSNHNFHGAVYVTRPLNHVGRFRVRTLAGEQETDDYFYKSVSYRYEKQQNHIVAAIEGERFALSSFKD